MTTKAKDEDKAELYRYTAFKLNDITYVPHYRDTKRYVGPGYPKHTNATFTASDLFSAGAVPIISFLWKRSEFGTLNSHTGKIG